MTSFRFAMIALFAGAALGAHPALAFTTANDSYTNADGSSKFSDPDDQLDHMADGNGASQPGVLQSGDHNSPFNFGFYQNDNSDRTSSALN